MEAPPGAQLQGGALLTHTYISLGEVCLCKHVTVCVWVGWRVAVHAVQKQKKSNTYLESKSVIRIMQ